MVVIAATKGNTSRACAACKYQRRRCNKECILAPYFPANQPEQFRNVHRLFGIANMTRILEEAPDDQKEDCVTSMKYESDMRAKFPVHGCVEIIRRLHKQILETYLEYMHLKNRIKLIKSQNSSESQDQLIIPQDEGNIFELLADNKQFDSESELNNSDILQNFQSWIQQPSNGIMEDNTLKCDTEAGNLLMDGEQSAGHLPLKIDADDNQME